MISIPYLQLSFIGKEEKVKLELVHGISHRYFVNNTKYFDVIPKDKSFCMLSGCITPAANAKNLAARFNWTKTNNISKADLIIVPKETIAFASFVYCRIISPVHQIFHFDENESLLNQLKLHYGEKIPIIIPYSHYGQKARLLREYDLFVDLYSADLHKDHLLLKNSQFSITGDLFYEEGLSKYIVNSQGTILNSQTCISLAKMLHSGQREDLNLAISILVKCNYHESALYILALIKEYPRKFESIKTKPFIALLSHYGIKPQTISFITIMDIVNSLKKIGCYSSENLEEFARINKLVVKSAIGLDVENDNTAFINDADEIEL